MDRQTDKRDLKLLEGDKYTFAVLSNILKGSCRLTLTDHERLIICHSADPYPVWIWTPDDISLDKKERAWQIVTQACPMTEGYRYNLKYDLAEFFILKAKEQGIDASIMTNMFAYDCPDPIAPKSAAAGHIYQCTWDDLEEAAEIIKNLHEEIAVDQNTYSLSVAKELINGGRLFFWKDNYNRTVSSCSYTPNGDLATVSNVYTFPAHRRKHYAETLVYHVTRLIKDTGAMPMLYTNADYAASNACYEKIGYVLRGKLCAIGVNEG